MTYFPLNGIKKEKFDDKNLSKFTNILIRKITGNLDKFNYNVIIANLYETYNFLVKEIEKEIDPKDLLGNYEKILKVINPILPHLSSECLEDINNKFNLNWPKIEDKYLIEENINIVIQINGKTRSIFKLKKNITEEELIEEIKKDTKLKKHIEGKLISKTIYIKNKLINLIIK